VAASRPLAPTFAPPDERSEPRSREAGPRGSNLRERKKAESQRRILEAAKTIFFRDGFKDANLDEVAVCAGVAKGTLYRYFDNKAELYVAVLAHDGKQFEDKLARAIDSSLSAPDQIRQLGRFYLRHYVEHPDYFQIFWAVENQELIGPLPEAVIESVTKLWERSLGVVAGTLERGVAEGQFAPHDCWAVANMLWTLANGAIKSEQSPYERRLRARPVDRCFEDLVELVLRGLAMAH
jgi:AcrR family transcriptional regulator